MKLKPLDRRTFLRGAGCAIALPFLSAMLPSMKTWAADSSPKRFMGVRFENGFYLSEGAGGGEKWRGEGTASDTVIKGLKLPESTLNVLGDMRNHLTVYRNIFSDAVDRQTGHNALSYTARVDYPSKGFTAAINSGKFPRRSFDQLIADYLYEHSKNSNGVSPISADMRSIVLSSNYVRNISIRDNVLVPRINDPRKLFNKLFLVGGNKKVITGGGGNEDEITRLKRRASILDGAIDDINTLNSKLSASDQAILDSHLTGIRATEKRIETLIDDYASVTPTTSPCSFPTKESIFNGSLNDAATSLKMYTHYLSSMFDLCAIALNCDLTRTIFFTIENGKMRLNDLDSRMNFPLHDNIIHKGRDSKGTRLHSEAVRGELVRKLDRYYMAFIKEFMQKLDSNIDGSGMSTLYNTLFNIGTEMSVGAQHSRRNINNIIAGNGGGSFTNHSGGFVDLPVWTGMSDMQFSMMKKFGLPINNWGKSNNKLLSQV